MTYCKHCGADLPPNKKIRVGMYRNYGIIKTRDYYVGKLYKMARKKLLFSLPKRKGIYYTKGATLITNDIE